MDKRKSKSNTTANMIIIAVIEYILFSTQNLQIFVFVATLLLGYIFYSSDIDRKGTSKILLIYGVVLSFFVYMFTFGFEAKDNIFQYILNALNTHVISFIVARCFANEYDFKKSIINISSGHILIYIAELAKYKFIDKINITDKIQSSFSNLVSSDLSNFSSQFSGEDISAIINQVQEIIIIIIPMLLILSAIIYSFVFYETFRFIVNSFTEKNFDTNNKFRFFSLKGGLSLFAIVMYILSIFSNDKMFSSVVLNFAIITSFLYFANGFAIAVFYLYKKIKIKALAVISSIVLLYAAIISVAILPSFNGIYILFILGLLDNRFDFRKIRKLSAIKKI